MNSSILCIVILILCLVPAVTNTAKHMKGEGDCCGGPKEKAPKKKINSPKLRDEVLKVEGMHCTNCKNMIERHVNELDGVICHVNLNKNIAKIEVYSDTVNMQDVIDTINKLDFKVVE